MSGRKTVFVGMSGGVDSSVSAYLLQKEGYDVVGVFFKVWHPNFLECHWEEERLDAMRTAAHLGIPFLTCNAEKEYKRDVADYFIREYQAGRTPNPDVMCNTYIKFGHFYDFAMSHGADHIATGHYARISIEGGGVALLRGVDSEKDQSYFLWNVKPDVLAHTLFPIGHLTKKDVRARAKKAKLPTAEKRESQGICFLGPVDMYAFLSHFISLREGKVQDEQGRDIGTHKGAVVYTIGQRHGFALHTVSDRAEPYYIVRKDETTNVLTVSHTKPVLKEDDFITLANVRWHGALPEVGTTLALQTRYRQVPVRTTILSLKGGCATLAPEEELEAPAIGQSAVLYEGEKVIGGGIMAS